ncbi:MAG TPA: hypothetical protein VFQ88_05685 [Nevskiaceae bacterium]|nr:hypothetical protein [Nevskiaceae bacterium]
MNAVVESIGEAASPLDDAKATVAAAIEAAAEDSEAVFAENVITALVAIRDADRAEFIRLRRKIKGTNHKSTLKDLDELVGIEAHDEERETQTNADQLVELVKSCTELFHAPDGDAYATIKADHDGKEVKQTWPIASSGFGEWMAATAWSELTLAVGDTLRKTAVTTLSGIAKFTGKEYPVALRCAENPNGAGFIIDLANDDWGVIEVTPTGWRVLRESPVRFWRTKTMRPLPIPERDGDLPALWAFANIAPADRPLVLAWMLEAWRPATAFPIAEFIGQQGSAKSSTQQTLRALIDPNDVPLRAAPKAVEDIFVAARNGWLASFNNLSHLSAPQQDALCGLATPGGFASRTLYTNGEETAWNTQRPVAINGISTLATAPDLIDRTIHIEPPRIETFKRDSDIHDAFESARPRILGALLDLFVATLAKLPSVTIAKPPRMADFACLGEAMMRAQGHEPGVFMALYGHNREQSALRALDASPVAQAVMSLVDRLGSWTGTYKDLRARLADLHHDGEAWPKSARGLADALRRTAPPLRTAGYTVTEDPTRRMDGKHVTLAFRRNRILRDVHDVHDVHEATAEAAVHEHHEHDERVYGLQGSPNACVSAAVTSSLQATDGYSRGEL